MTLTKLSAENKGTNVNSITGGLHLLRCACKVTSFLDTSILKYVNDLLERQWNNVTIKLVHALAQNYSLEHALLFPIDTKILARFVLQLIDYELCQHNKTFRYFSVKWKELPLAQSSEARQRKQRNCQGTGSVVSIVLACQPLSIVPLWFLTVSSLREVLQGCVWCLSFFFLLFLFYSI